MGFRVWHGRVGVHQQTLITQPRLSLTGAERQATSEMVWSWICVLKDRAPDVEAEGMGS